MKTIAFSFLFLLSISCSSHSAPGKENAIYRLSPAKQKQKLNALVKKLESAEKEKERILDEVEKLNSQIHETQLALIRRQLDESEIQMKEHPHKYILLLKEGTLFSQEREALHQMMQDGPAFWTFEAQVELDRILRLITELSENHD